MRMIASILALAAGGVVYGQSAVSMKDRLEVILKRQDEARERFSKDLKGKTTAEAQKPVMDRASAETVTNNEEVLALVLAHPHDPAVVEALRFVIKNAGRGPGDQSYRAMELLQGHEREPGMGEVCGRIFHFGHFPVAEALIRAVLERHPERFDRGQACHQLAVYKMLQAGMVRRIRERPATIDEYINERHKTATAWFVKEADLDALDHEAETLLERVVAEFAYVPDWYDKRPLGAVAEGELFALRNLSVGKVAPEVVGRDHEGKPFALGDYRGKVVVLTFSGNWCGPCVGMYPLERELVTRHASKPFALLSVSTDNRRETLRESISRGDITWRCWWDGGMTGPITTRWGIRSFPSIFVLDKAGMIRFKDVRGEDLERGVASLLNEAAGKIPAR